MTRCMKCMEKYNDNLKACPKCNTLINAKAIKAYHLPTNTMLIGKYTVGIIISESSVNIRYIGYDNIRSCKVIIYEYFPQNLVIRGADNLIIFENSVKSDLFAKSLSAYVKDIEKLISISDIQGVEKITDYFIENNTCYVVCEYESQIELNKYLKRKSINKTSIMFQLLYTLKALQKNDIIHGNISPDHIIVTGNRNIKLIDFGVGSFINSTGISIYNPNYSPIEAKDSNSKLYPYSDIYSAGAVFYKMFSGVTPYSVEERLNGKEIISLIKLGIRINRNTDNAILNSINLKPENRYNSASEFLLALKKRSAKRIYENINGSDKRFKYLGNALLIMGALAVIVFLAFAIVYTAKHSFNTNAITSETTETTSVVEVTSVTETTSVMEETDANNVQESTTIAEEDKDTSDDDIDKNNVVTGSGVAIR